MALRRLLDRMAQEGVEPRFDLLSRWFETEPEAPGAAPTYGEFVDPEGVVVWGLRPPRAFLRNDEVRHLELGAQTASSLGAGITVVFLDWGHQPLLWAEVFDLWDAWVAQGQVLDCGTVGVPWAQAHRWEAPGWIAFREGFDGAPLVTQIRTAEPPTRRASPGGSFLARALKLRSRSRASEPMEELPAHPAP
jgi:hypothetical protein